MMRRFLAVFSLVFFAGAALALDSDVLDYRSIGPKEQAAGHMKRLTDPDGSVRRDGANLLSREIERVLPELGMTPQASAFLSEVGAGLSALLLTDNATIRVRAERVMDQLVAGFVSASTSKDAPMKTEGINGLKFLAQRVKADETRAAIAGALKKLKIEMPAFDEALAKQYELPRVEGASEPLQAETPAAPAVQVSVTIPAGQPEPSPASLAAAPEPPAASAPAAAPEAPKPAADAPKSSGPRKIVVRSLAGAAAPKPAAPAPSSQVISVSLKDLKKTPPQKPAAAAPTEAAEKSGGELSAQDHVVLKMLLDKLAASDEQGKLVGLEFAQKLTDTVLKAKESEDIVLKNLVTDDLLAVRRLFGDPSASVRMKAIEVSGAFRDAEAVPLIVQRLEDPDTRVRQAAHDALVTITGKDLGKSPADWKELAPPQASADAGGSAAEAKKE